MARILIHVYPAISHLNATLALAADLRRRGHEVIYASVPELRKHVASHGYRMEVIRDEAPHPLKGRHAPRWSFWDKLRRAAVLRRFVRDRRRAIERHSMYAEVIRQVAPDLLLIDAHYTPFVVGALGCGTTCGIFSTKLGLNRHPDYPPIQSSLVPSGTPWSRWRCALAWRAYLVRRRIGQFLELNTFPTHASLAEAARRHGTSDLRFDFERCLIVGLPAVPELILAPDEFDFPHQPKPHQLAIGPSVYWEREEAGYDARFDREWAAFADSPTPLVYCSLGSLPWQYRGTGGFFSRLIAAADGSPWRLVLATGPDWSARDFGPLPRNVAIFQHVPQLRVLRRASAMVTHGGINSIAECLHAGVPMLVCPGSSDVDQEGNAARVEFHRVGRRLRLRRATSGQLRQEISTLLGDPGYRANAAALQRRILASDACREGAARLERLFQLYRNDECEPACA